MYNWITHTKKNATFLNLVMFIYLPAFLNVLWIANNNVWDTTFKYICVHMRLIKLNRNLLYLNY